VSAKMLTDDVGRLSNSLCISFKVLKIENNVEAENGRNHAEKSHFANDRATNDDPSYLHWREKYHVWNKVSIIFTKRAVSWDLTLGSTRLPPKCSS